MWRLGVLFLVIALIAALVGYGGVAGEFGAWAQRVFIVFLVLGGLSLAAAVGRNRF